MRRKKSGLNFGKQRKKINIPFLKEVLSWIIEIAIVIFVAYVVINFWGVRTTVVGQAMEDTLENGDQILLDKFIYVATNPKPGDVVVFLPNGNEKSHYYVRRIIGVPGDKVQIMDGAVYVNDQLFDEKINVSSIEDPGIAAEGIELGDGEYFVLGDNRNNSEDSRHANIGIVKKEYIMGKAWFRFNSIREMGYIY